jgi:hypothetical protein
VSMNTSFHGGSNETIGGLVRLRRPGFEVVLWSQGPLIRAFGVSMDASFHGGSNDTIAAASDPNGRRYCCLIVSTVFSPLSLTLANNFSAVSLTPAIKLLPGVVDTGQK